MYLWRHTACCRRTTAASVDGMPAKHGIGGGMAWHGKVGVEIPGQRRRTGDDMVTATAAIVWCVTRHANRRTNAPNRFVAGHLAHLYDCLQHHACYRLVTAGGQRLGSSVACATPSHAPLATFFRDTPHPTTPPGRSTRLPFKLRCPYPVLLIHCSWYEYYIP